MAGSRQIFLVTLAQDMQAAQNSGAPCVYLVYTVRDGMLRYGAEPPRGRGGLMGIYGDGEAFSSADPHRTGADIAAQCRKRGLEGAVLDFSEDEGSFSFAAAVSPILHSQGVTHYLPVSFASVAPEAKLIVPSAVSGGSFTGMLADYESRFGADRLCLELVRTQNDFVMPSLSTNGASLSLADFERLYSENGGVSFFSKELCCRYFTYMDKGTAHFVMFDDDGTAREKLIIARRRGWHTAFALYSEWREYAQELARFDAGQYM